MPRIDTPEGHLTYNLEGNEHTELGMYVCFPEVATGFSRHLPPVQAHDLADWIIENVPKPEKPVLPTAFGAIIRSGGELYTLADPKAEYSGWRTADQWTHTWDIEEQGFEVVFEGVADD